jgi:hypothetical protein
MAWQLAIHHYHKGNSLVNAKSYFEKMFRKNFVENVKNDREMNEYISLIEAYVAEFEKQGLIFIESKAIISIPLTDKLKLAGELPIICMDNDLGYVAYFFYRDNKPWASELKYPIIQNHIASSLYGVSIGEVKIGVFDVLQQKIILINYSQEDVDDAVEELENLSKEISSML